MDHPRVLHLIGSLEPGGTERQLVGFIQRSSDPARHAVAVFSRRGELAAELPSEPVVVGPAQRRLLGAPSVADALLDLRRLISASRPDVVHAHLGYSEVFAALASPRGLPIVASRRGLTPVLERSFPGRMLMAAAHRRERMLICNSADLERRARAERCCPPTVVIPNGVDLSVFTPSPEPAGPPTVAVVARLRPGKGHDLFLRSFRSVVDRVPDARAVLVGGGPIRTELESLTSRLGLDSAVRFVGDVPDPRPHLGACHVVALTSSHEGTPNALLEAMASARPVVATAVGGVPELIENGVNGVVVPLDDQAISDALVDLLRDPPRRRTLGDRARLAAARYDWGAVVARTESVYEKVLRPSVVSVAS